MFVVNVNIKINAYFSCLKQLASGAEWGVLLLRVKAYFCDLRSASLFYLTPVHRSTALTRLFDAIYALVPLR